MAQCISSGIKRNLLSTKVRTSYIAVIVVVFELFLLLHKAERDSKNASKGNTRFQLLFGGAQPSVFNSVP